MPYEFDSNDNPELLPIVDQPLPPPSTEAYYLNQNEIQNLIALEPTIAGTILDRNGFPINLGVDQVRRLRGILAEAGMNSVPNLNAQGIPAQTNRQYMQSGLISEGGGDDFHSEEIYGAGTATKKFPATNVPKQWRMVHQRAKGGHICYVSRTEAAYFTRKASANAFCRAWNEMISHLGSAAEFDQLRLASLFAAILEAGSGQSGLANGFRPPLNGN